MKKSLVSLLVVCVAAVLFSSGCASAPAKAAAGPDPRAMHRSVQSHLVAPVTGTFTVSYIPAVFSEPYDIRANRHRNIALMIGMSLEQAGLKRTDRVPNYEVRYTYRTSTAFSGTGFRHGFDITISRSKEATGDYPEDLVWTGSAWIDRWPNRDITALFATFIDELLKGFSEPTHGGDGG